jgi:hypothetical protein
MRAGYTGVMHVVLCEAARGALPNLMSTLRADPRSTVIASTCAEQTGSRLL